MPVILEEGQLIPNRCRCLQNSIQTLHYSNPEGMQTDPTSLNMLAKIDANVAYWLSWRKHSWTKSVPYACKNQYKRCILVILEEAQVTPNRHICLQKSIQTLQTGHPGGRTTDPKSLQMLAKIDTNAALQ